MDLQVKVLVVEDLLTTQLMIKRILKKIGFQEIVLAEDGKSALEELKKGRFGLIVSDWKMPNMSGLEFLQEVRKKRLYQDVPFIMLTSESDKDKVIEAMKAGVSQYIVKPPSVEILKAKVEAAMDN